MPILETPSTEDVTVAQAAVIFSPSLNFTSKRSSFVAKSASVNTEAVLGMMSILLNFAGDLTTYIGNIFSSAQLVFVSVSDTLRVLLINKLSSNQASI
jgi:hypothetical protein